MFIRNVPNCVFLAILFLMASGVNDAALSEVSVPHEESSATQAVKLDDLVRMALEKNPGIQSKKRAYLAAQSKVFGAFLPQDPTFGVDVEGQPNIFDFGQRTDNEFSAEQTIPFPSKLILKGIIAAKDAQVMYQQYKEEERDAIWHIEQPYYELILARKTIAALEETKGLLEQVVQSATSRYESGQTGQSDPLKAQIELSRVSIEIFDWKEKEHLAQAHFSHILNRSLEEEYKVEENIERSTLTYTRSELHQLVLKKRPELKALSVAIEKAKANRSLARQEWLPDLSLRYEGRQPKGKDPITEHDTFLGVTVPLWSLIRGVGGGWKSSNQELASTEAAYDKVKNEALLKVHEAYSKLKSAENAVSLFEKAILPKGRQLVELALSSYEAGKGDFFSVIDAQRTLKAAKIEYCKSLANYEMAFSDLKFAVGDNLEGTRS